MIKKYIALDFVIMYHGVMETRVAINFRNRQITDLRAEIRELEEKIMGMENNGLATMQTKEKLRTKMRSLAFLMSLQDQLGLKYA